MVSSATNAAPVDYSQLFAGVAPTPTADPQRKPDAVAADAPAATPTVPDVDYGQAFGEFADAAAQESQKKIADAQERVIEVKPDGKVSIAAETAFAGKTVANNNPKFKIDAEIFLRNIDALNKQFIFGPYLNGDIRTNLDYQKVLTNVRVTETEPDPFTGETSFDEHEEKTSVLVFDKWSANADVGFKAIHELLPQGSNDKNAIQDSLQFSWAIPVSLAMEENAQDDKYPLPADQKAEEYYTNYWLGTRPMLGLSLTTHINKLPLTISMENTVGLLWGAPWYTTNSDQQTSFRFEEENKLKFDWEFTPGLTWKTRNSFSLISYDWNKTDISEEVSTGLELKLMQNTFAIELNPFIYRLDCTVPSSGNVADAYNGKIQYAADLNIAFDITKDATFNLGIDYTYAGMNKAEENTAAAKPLKISASIDLKL